MNNTSTLPQATSERCEVEESGVDVRASSHVDAGSDENTASPSTRPGAEIDSSERPLRRSSDSEGQEKYIPQPDDEDHVASFQNDSETSFLVDDDRNWPHDGSLPHRQDRAAHDRPGGSDDGHDVFTPKQLTEQEEGVDIRERAQHHQLLPQQPHGDRCRTRGRQKERVARGTSGLGRCTPRARSQVCGFIRNK